MHFATFSIKAFVFSSFGKKLAFIKTSIIMPCILEIAFHSLRQLLIFNLFSVSFIFFLFLTYVHILKLGFS